MNKIYKAKIMSALEQTKAEDLGNIYRKLVWWQSNHEKKKASYFWSPPSSASSRRWEEKKNSFEESVVIGESKICYWSDCSMSCKHIYWKDGIYLADSDVKVNFGDIETIIEGIDDLLNSGLSADNERTLTEQV